VDRTYVTESNAPLSFELSVGRIDFDDLPALTNNVSPPTADLHTGRSACCSATWLRIMRTVVATTRSILRCEFTTMKNLLRCPAFLRQSYGRGQCDRSILRQRSQPTSVRDGSDQVPVRAHNALGLPRRIWRDADSGSILLAGGLSQLAPNSRLEILLSHFKRILVWRLESAL